MFKFVIKFINFFFWIKLKKYYMFKRKYSRFEMALICWTLGIFGIHRLLMGYKNWYLQFFTLGGLGLWMLYDLFFIIIGKMKMANGQSLL